MEKTVDVTQCYSRHHCCISDSFVQWSIYHGSRSLSCQPLGIIIYSDKPIINQFSDELLYMWINTSRLLGVVQLIKLHRNCFFGFIILQENEMASKTWIHQQMKCYQSSQGIWTACWRWRINLTSYLGSVQSITLWKFRENLRYLSRNTAQAFFFFSLNYHQNLHHPIFVKFQKYLKI